MKIFVSVCLLTACFIFGYSIATDRANMRERAVKGAYRALVDVAIEHDEECHDCDCPFLDGGEYENVIELLNE